MTWRRVASAWLARYWIPLAVVVALLAAPLYLAYFAWIVGACGPFFMPRT